MSVETTVIAIWIDLLHKAQDRKLEFGKEDYVRLSSAVSLVIEQAALEAVELVCRRMNESLVKLHKLPPGTDLFPKPGG